MDDMQKSDIVALVFIAAIAVIVWGALVFSAGMSAGEHRGKEETTAWFEADNVDHIKSRNACWYENEWLRGRINELEESSLEIPDATR